MSLQHFDDGLSISFLDRVGERLKTRRGNTIEGIGNCLRFFIENRWVGPPPWAESLIKLGASLAKEAVSPYRHVLGLSVPTRAYSAVFVATGLILERAVIPVAELDSFAHFEYLCSLPPDTSLSFVRAGKKFKAVSEGATRVYGERRLRVRVQNKLAENKLVGGLTHLLSVEQCKSVVVTQGKTNLPGRQAGRAISRHTGFLTSLLGVDHASEFATRRRFDCVILGGMNVLRREITETRTRIRVDGLHYEEGMLQDLLRAREFMSEGHAYRSAVFSANAGGKQPLVDGNIPFMTIFDGAAGFLKWRDEWRKSHWLVILDRTEPHFREAVEMFNQEYIQNRADDVPSQLAIGVPESVELVHYRDRIR